MAKPEEFSPGDLDLTSLHTEPEPDDVVQPTPDVVAAAKVASALNLPASSVAAATNNPDNQHKKAGRRRRGAPAKPLVQAQAPAAQPPVAPTLAKAAAKATAQPAAAPTLAKAAAKAVAQPVAPVAQPPIPKASIERAKGPEAKAKAYATYFADVHNHRDFLRKIAVMTSDPTLQQAIGVTALEKVMPKVNQEIFAWHEQFEEKKGTAKLSELNRLANEVAEKLPDGFAGILRRVVFEEASTPNISGTSASGIPLGPDGKPTVEGIIGPAKKAGETSAPRTAEAVSHASGGAETPETSSRAEWIAELKRKLNPRTAPTTEVETPSTPSSAGTTPEASESARREAQQLAGLRQRLNPRGETVPAPESVPTSPGEAGKTEKVKTVFESLVEFSAPDILKVVQEAGAKTFALALKRRDSAFLNIILNALPSDGANTIRNEMTELGRLSIRIGDKGGEGYVTLPQVVQAEKEVERAMAKVAVASTKAKMETPSNFPETGQKAESLSTAEQTGERKKLTPENVGNLRFQDIFDLNDEDLKLVVLASRRTAFSWGITMYGMEEQEQRRIRSALEAHPHEAMRSVSDFDESLRESTTEDAQKWRTNFLDSDERKTLVELLKKRDEAKS